MFANESCANSSDCIPGCKPIDATCPPPNKWVDQFTCVPVDKCTCVDEDGNERVVSALLC
jgi:hypothetical protein